MLGSCVLIHCAPSRCACDQPPSAWKPISTTATLYLPAAISGIWKPVAGASVAGASVAEGTSVTEGASVAAGASVVAGAAVGFGPHAERTIINTVNNRATFKSVLRISTPLCD